MTDLVVMVKGVGCEDSIIQVCSVEGDGVYHLIGTIYIANHAAFW